MSIDIEDIQKYIFDPNKPKQCKSYKLLLKIAKNENISFISPSFLQYFFGSQIINRDFENELWDKPPNYESLNAFEKLNLFKDNLSLDELKEFINNLDLNFDKFKKYTFLDKFFTIDKTYENEYKMVPKKSKPKPLYFNAFNSEYEEVEVRREKLCFKVSTDDVEEYFKKLIVDNIYKNDISYSRGLQFSSDKYLKNIIFFSLKYYDLLFSNVKKSSIIVTLLENKNDFFKKYNDISSSKNIKPLFLKKIEDVDLLLNVLQEDLKKEKQKEIEREDISSLDSIHIKNFYSIKDLKIDRLKDKKEIYLVGENGDGKTLFLQSLVLGLKGIEEGDVFNLIKSTKEYEIYIIDSNDKSYDSKGNEYKNVFAYGANRNNNCQMKEDETGYLTLFNSTLDLKNPIDWLKYLDHSEKSEKTNVISVDTAKKLLKNLLSSDIEIDINPDNVVFSEKGSKVTFEQLSAGYKGVITIIADLLVRLSENQPYISDISEFKGIVLIDEVELHLHPKWKYNFVSKLRNVFPNIQFIMTTHSPTVLLGASKEAVFYKIYKENGEVHISNQIPNEGYTNNTLISSPLFDMDTVKSRHYENAISSDDYVYEKIHQVVSKKIKNDIDIDEDKILAFIEEELEKND